MEKGHYAVSFYYRGEYRWQIINLSRKAGYAYLDNVTSKHGLYVLWNTVTGEDIAKTCYDATEDTCRVIPA